VGFRSDEVRETRILPAGYKALWTLDLARSKKSALLLNFAAFPLLVLFGWTFAKIAVLLRPEILSYAFYREIPVHPFVFFFLFLGMILGIMVLHEAIHGFFFWYFTQSRPIFGVRLLFAYAGAPEWYIPRIHYAIIGFAPLVVITVAGFLLIWVLSLQVGQLVLFGIVMNASGAVGDLYVSFRVLGQSGSILVQDTGVGFTVYGHGARPGEPVSENYQKGMADDER
jgi:hypothetical protein